MPLNQCSLQEHFTWFLSNPKTMVGGMISIFEPAKLSAIERSVSTSTASSLDRLPLELLHMICASLDFRSLSRLSRTSLRNKAIVESHPPYHNLMKYAPRTLNALGKTRLISAHSSALLHAALRSAQCLSCGQYGAFLFLPTCERICRLCLIRNHSFWMIPETKAKKCFDLAQRHLNKIPVMYSIPDMYNVGHYSSCGRRRRLYDVKSVKKLAIKTHGSETKLKELVPALPSLSFGDEVDEYHLFNAILNAPLEPYQSDPLTILKEKGAWDDWCGMASIHFPSLPSQDSLESGLWCVGCEHLHSNYSKLDSTTISRLVPADVEPRDYFNGMKYRARSKADFLEHVQNCHGVEMLISESGDTSDYR